LIKITCIYGSPRKDGNTDILLNKFIEGLKISLDFDSKKTNRVNSLNNSIISYRLEKIYVRELNIYPCRECGKCEKTGICVIDDDMKKVYPLLETSNYLIISAPIFFCNVPSNLKILIDRTQCYWARKYILKQKLQDIKPKLGIYLGVCGSRHIEFFNCCKLTVKYFFDVFNLEYYKDFFVSKIDGYQKILQHEDILYNVYNLGKNLLKN